MKYYKKIAGERVYLSPLNVDDAELYAKWLNDPTVMTNLDANRWNNSYVHVKDWFTEQAKKCDSAYRFAIVTENGDTPIGLIDFITYELVHGTATVGVFIGDEEYRSNGYGTEAVKLLVGYGFDMLRLNNINLAVLEFNERAYKAYIKAGFKEYGRRRKAYCFKGELYDVVEMDIIREDYYGSKIKEDYYEKV